MRHNKKTILLFICFVCIMFSTNLHAQLSIVQNTLDKIAGYKNLSYTSVNKVKEYFTIDTAVSQAHSLFIKMPEDKSCGYIFRVQTKSQNDPLGCTDIYDGEKSLHIYPKDQTYEERNDHIFGNTLLGDLKWLEGRLKMKSRNIIKAKDTMLNAKNNHHLIVTVYDSIINGERNYTDAHLFINERTDLPDLMIVISRSTQYGNGISNYYSEAQYTDYKTDQKNISKVAITNLKGLQPRKEKPAIAAPALLAAGDIAPNWTLYNSDCEQTSFAQLKGKVVLLDFFFIGCFGCMQSLKPLNALHEKYKDKNVEMVSMTFRDNKRAATVLQKKLCYTISYLY